MEAFGGRAKNFPTEWTTNACVRKDLVYCTFFFFAKHGIIILEEVCSPPLLTYCMYQNEN